MVGNDGLAAFLSERLHAVLAGPPWGRCLHCHMFLAPISILLFGHLGDKIGRRAPLAAVGHALAAAGIYFGAFATDNMTAALLISFGIASIGDYPACFLVSAPAHRSGKGDRCRLRHDERAGK